MTLIELLFVLVLMVIVSAMAIPQVNQGLARARAMAAARYLAGQCATAKFKAVGGSASVGLRFQPRDDDYELQMFADGNENGIRTADIGDGIDKPLAPPERLMAKFQGVRIGVAEGLGLDGDPVRLGTSGILTFTPLGTASSGSIYVVGADGTQLAVRVLGVTARTRLLRYDPRTRQWEAP